MNISVLEMLKLGMFLCASILPSSWHKAAVMCQRTISLLALWFTLFIPQIVLNAVIPSVQFLTLKKERVELLQSFILVSSVEAPLVLDIPSVPEVLPLSTE